MLRLLPLALLVTLAGCASQRVSLEGLRPRAAEAIDPRVPLPTAPVAGPADARLASRIAELEQRAQAGAAAFDALVPSAQAAASAAGAQGSESWIEAQERLSALVGARAPVSLALADLDAIGGATVEARGDVAVADREMLGAASRRVAAIDTAQQETIAALRVRLQR